MSDDFHDEEAIGDVAPPTKPTRRLTLDSDPAGLYLAPDGKTWPSYERQRKRLAERARRMAKRQANNTEALRLFFESEALAFGLPLDEMLATIRPGPVSASERPAYERLARVVYELRTGRLSREQATVANVLRLKEQDEKMTPLALASIGTALGGLTRKQVQRLEDRGREVVARGCPKHDRFRDGCPACIEGR
jgi:hypothetical protein